ncbi:MAG: hypothetical protein K2K53_00005, partial [Oscillospiraceae bacterium]|nr:hypothetical protein [Oscillospiraceae bacterium]
MNGKRFFLGVVAGAAICFGVLAGLLWAADPFFVLHGLGEGDTARFHNQRYQMAGLIRHQEYSAVVMGTSLAANYRASWFTQALGEETLKITFPDGWVSEFDTALRLAFRTHPQLDKVYFCLDPNILVRSDNGRTVELPQYLYNLNPLDDVEYLLNADTCQEALRGWLHRDTQEMVPLDDAYLWDTQYTFSKAWAIAGYPRPEIAADALPSNAYLEAADENLERILGWAEEHPDVEFVIWYPPYSMLYWDKVTRDGARDAILTAAEYAAGRLLERGNVDFHSFLLAPA